MVLLTTCLTITPPTLHTESLTWEQIDVSGVEGFPDIEENYSLMLSDKKALLVHSSHSTHAVASRQSQSLESAVSVLRLESTQKRMKLLSSPTATYSAPTSPTPGEQQPSPRSLPDVNGVSPRRKASIRENRRNRRNTLGKRRGLDSQSSFSSFYDDSTSEGTRSTILFYYCSRPLALWCVGTQPLTPPGPPRPE
jgi:hypothetical protein